MSVTELHGFQHMIRTCLDEFENGDVIEDFESPLIQQWITNVGTLLRMYDDMTLVEMGEMIGTTDYGTNEYEEQE